MPAFNGRKTGEGDPSRVAEMMPYAEQQSYIHAEMLKSAGLTAGVRVVPFDGGWLRSTITGTLRHVHVVVGTPETKVGESYRPLDYYSGMVFGGDLTIKSDLELLAEYGEKKDAAPKPVAKLYSFYPEPETVAKFPPHELTEDEKKIEAKDRTYYDGFSTAYAPVQVTKLAVKVYNGLLSMTDTAPLKYTGTASTYSHIRPTMFTGTMRKVVQFVMGIGKVLQPSWYPGVTSTVALEQTLAFTSRDLFNEKTEGDGAVQLQYDFRYGNCHGAYKEDKVWWLVRVSQALGIVAMPLPLDPISALPAFRKALEALGTDSPTKSDIDVLDTFGGFPSGATFDNRVEAFIRAGQYVRLAKLEDLPDYTSTTVWGDQIGWSFSYDGKLAKCVAYEDIPLTGFKVCRAVRDMLITTEIKTDTSFTIGILGEQLRAALIPHLPVGADAKPWHLPKLDRMTEGDAGTLLTALAQATNDEGKFDPDKVASLLVTFENMQAQPIGTGTSKLTVGGRWCFTPAGQLFKTANLPYDMCPSITWPVINVLTPTGPYRAPAEGSKVPLYRWFLKDGTEMAIWFDMGAKGSYTDHTGAQRVAVEYTSRTVSCYVEKVPLTTNAEDIYASTYSEYKSAGQHHTTLGFSSANDVSPEGYYRTDWLLTKNITNRAFGGLEKADIEYGSAYMVFGDAEAAVEFNYHHHPATPAWTTGSFLSTTGNAYSYDFAYEYKTDTNGTILRWGDGSAIFNRYFTTCGQNEARTVLSYCSWPYSDKNYINKDAWRKPQDYPAGSFVISADDGNWSKPGATVAWYGGVPAPEIPATENFPATSAWSKRTTRVYAGSKEPVSTYEDENYIARDRAWLDILELQKSLYDPPEDSPYVEHDIRGTRNSYSKISGGYMRAVNDYTYVAVGELLHANQTGDMPCFIGVIL